MMHFLAKKSLTQIAQRRKGLLTAILLLSLFVILFFSTSSVSFAANPEIDWKKIETTHFEIIYDSRHHQLAKDFARHAETAWSTLAPVFRTWPDKTVVLIDDSGDEANGMATGVPYPQIHLYPASPSPGETIADSGPWGLELMTHEYAHVLNFQPAHGVFHTLRNIFGTIVRPNLLLPRWYLEGLAVELETRYSPSGGRLRSPDFTAIPRAMVQDNILRFENVARIGETSIPDWPGGARPYLLGGLIWQKLLGENPSIVGDLNEHYARRVPFFIDTPLEERTGKNWQSYLESMYTDLEGRAVQQIEILCENGCNEGRKLGEVSFFTRSPVISTFLPFEKQSLAFITREHNHDSVVMIADRSKDPATAGFDIANAVRAEEPTSSHRLSWMPDGQSLIYDGIDSFGRYEERSDLWLYRRGDKKTLRLSKGLRAREPDVSLDGKRVAFVQLTPGQSQIAIADFVLAADGKMTVGSPTVLYVPTRDHRVSWPTFTSPKTLVFVERSPQAEEVLKVLDLRTGSTVTTPSAAAPRLVSSGGSVTFPRLVVDSKNGRRNLLFTSNRTGVSNIYIADLLRDMNQETARSFALENVRPLTNSVTRAWSADLDLLDESLIYSRLDGDGSRLRRLTASDRGLNQTVRENRLRKIPLLVERNHEPHVVPESTLSDSYLPAQDFSVWPYLIPRYWMPYAAFVPGGAFLSASTSSGDPMGRHLLATSISTDTRIGKPNFFGAYSNATTPVRTTLMVDDFWQRLSSSGFDRRSTTGDLSGTFFIPSLSNSWRGELGVSHQRTEIPLTAGGADVRIRGGPRAGILWQDMTQKGFEISPEKGGHWRFSHARFLPELGNLVYDKTDLSVSTFSSRISGPKVFGSKLFGWLPERHVLNASFAASWLPGLDRLLLGPSSVSLPVETVALGASSTSFVMRGYPSGTFLARKLVRGSIEHRFPLSNSYHGFGTNPAFIKRWHGAVFADLVTIEGAFYDFDAQGYRSSGIGNMFGTVGAEARLDTTLFYHLPVQFILGYHWGFDKRANPNGAYPIVSIAL